MSQELIYTSAPQGLKPGSKGFCTVAMTTSVTASWVERLESLSGYRPIFPLGDPQSTRNPINWAHWRITLAGKTRSVLSRVAFAGVDYSQRSNKLAHHIVLEPSEQAPAGPAWMMLQNGVMRAEWTGAAQQFPTGPTLPISDRVPRICSAWTTAMGDAGWAAALAESFAHEPSKPAYLIYPPGMDVLALFEESQSLLSPQQRWEVTFSTFFTELPLKLSCAWRAVVAGTSAAMDASRAGTKAMILDLTKPPKTISLPAGDYADAARDGRSVVTPPIAASRPAAAGMPVSTLQALEDSGGASSELNLTEETAFPAPITSARAERKSLVPVGIIPLYGDPSAERHEPRISRRMAQMPGKVYIDRGVRSSIAAAIAVACLLVGGATGYFLGRTQLLRAVPRSEVSLTPPTETSDQNSHQTLSTPISPTPPSNPQPAIVAVIPKANPVAVVLPSTKTSIPSQTPVTALPATLFSTGTHSTVVPTSPPSDNWQPIDPDFLHDIGDGTIDTINSPTGGFGDSNTFPLSKNYALTSSGVLGVAWPNNEIVDSCKINDGSYELHLEDLADSPSPSLRIEATHKAIGLGVPETENILDIHLDGPSLLFDWAPTINDQLREAVFERLHKSIFILKQGNKTIARFAFSQNSARDVRISDLPLSLSVDAPPKLHAEALPDWDVIASNDETTWTYTRTDDSSLKFSVLLTPNDRDGKHRDMFLLGSDWKEKCGKWKNISEELDNDCKILMDQNNLQTLDDKQLYDLDVRAAIREVDDAIHRVITAQKNFNAAQSRLDALNQNFNASDAEKTATHQAYNGARDELNNAKEDLGKKRKPQAALATNHDRVMNLAKESNVGNFVVNVMEPNGILLRTITINTAEP